MLKFLCLIASRLHEKDTHRCNIAEDILNLNERTQERAFLNGSISRDVPFLNCEPGWSSPGVYLVCMNDWVGLYPIASQPLSGHAQSMKHNKYPQNQTLADAPGRVAELERNEAGFAHSPDEIARKAYFAYVNQGSLPGHEVQHWLKAEAELIAERDLTRTHGFHNKT